MFGLLTLGALVVGGLFVLGLVGGLLKLLFKLIFLPFLLLGFLLKLAVGLMLLPVLIVAGAIGIIGVLFAGLFAVALPLLPLVLAGALVVALVKWLGRPAAAARS